MPDLLIRNFPAAELAVLDFHASRLGLSRNEYVRRQLLHAAHHAETHLSLDDLEAFAGLTEDLADEDVMRQAWT